MSSFSAHVMGCMELRGGNCAAHERIELPGLEVWVHAVPFAGGEQGGDIHSLSSCGTGRISRLVLADVSGHGAEVARFATGLRRLMTRFMNYLDQTRFVEALNRELAVSSSSRFATSLAMTYFSPCRRLDICNAGHPRPLRLDARSGEWSVLFAEERGLDERRDPRPEPHTNLPLGVLEPTRYDQFGIELGRGDLVLAFTDAVLESRGADGVMLGEAGLLSLVRSLHRRAGTDAPARLLTELIAELDARRGGTPAEDDLTLMLLRCVAGREQRSFLRRLGAGVRFLARLGRRLVPVGTPEPVPWPEPSVPNMLGPFVPAAARSWRGPRGAR